MRANYSGCYGVPRHSKNAHTIDPCPIKVLRAFSPRRGLASPRVNSPPVALTPDVNAGMPGPCGIQDG